MTFELDTCDGKIVKHCDSRGDQRLRTGSHGCLKSLDLVLCLDRFDYF